MKNLINVLESHLGNVLKNTGHTIPPKKLLRPGLYLEVDVGEGIYVMDKRKFKPLMYEWLDNDHTNPVSCIQSYNAEKEDYVLVHIYSNEYAYSRDQHIDFAIWPSTQYDDDLQLYSVTKLFTICSAYEYDFTYHETIEELWKYQKEKKYKKNKLVWQRDN